jgi:hypothetical protein
MCIMHPVGSSYIYASGKVKVKGTPYRPRRTHRVSGGIAQLLLNLGTRRGCMVSISPGRLYPRERPGTHCTRGRVGPGAGRDRCRKSRPTGIRSPDLQVRSVVAIPTTLPGSAYIYRVAYGNS